MTTLANQRLNRNTASEISTKAQDLLGHMRAQILTARERDDLWDIAYSSNPVTAVQITTVERIEARLEGRRAA